MKREKVIELARKSGVGPSHPALAMREADIQAVEQLVALVEKETLERAAKVCESWRGGKLLLNAGEMSADEFRTVRAVTEAAGREIRNLKDDHGQD